MVCDHGRRVALRSLFSQPRRHCAYAVWQSRSPQSRDSSYHPIARSDIWALADLPLQSQAKYT